jgi:hypothetical protein
VSAYDFDFELYSLSKEDYKDLIFDEIMLYHDDNAAREYENNRRDHPEGILSHRYGKDRIKKKFLTTSK